MQQKKFNNYKVKIIQHQTISVKQKQWHSNASMGTAQ